jgi:hypothetical protein
MNEKTKENIDSLIKSMESKQGYSGVQRPMMARVQFLIAEEQALSAEKVERQTEKLIGLTWALVGLTVALLLLTTFLCYDVYKHRESVTLTK